MEQTLLEIARKIAAIGRARQQIADALAQINQLGLAKFKERIEDRPFDGLIVGVDGGFLKKELHGINFILRRAVATLFEYKNSKLISTGYFPNKKPIPEPIVVGPEFSEKDFGSLAALKREEIELKIAIEVAKRFSPSMIIRDGSIVLHPSAMPEKKSYSYKVYKEVIKLFKMLYKICDANEIMLVGAIEDSRSKKYTNLIYEKAIPKLIRLRRLPHKIKNTIKDNAAVLVNTTDTLLLYHLLNVGERTIPAPYAEISQTPILKDLEGWSKAIYCTYIKSVEFDRPLRIDFLATKDVYKTAEKITSIIWQISRQNRTYSYPAPLIEADARAKLGEHEIYVFKKALQEKLGRSPSLFELRREMRPF